MSVDVRAAGRWFWSLDRRVPWNAWSWVIAAGLLLRLIHWLVGNPDHLLTPVGIAIGVLAGTFLLAWLVLYERDAVRARRARRVERAKARAEAGGGSSG